MKTSNNKHRTYAIKKFKILMASLLFLFMAAFGIEGDQNNHPSMHENKDDKPVTTTVSGQLSGFDCAVVGFLCPSTHRGADYTVGVVTDDKKYFHLVNIPQSFFRQYFLEQVEVTGNVYPPYDKSVEPETVHVVNGNKKRLVYEEGYFIDKNGRKATFQEGVYKDGQWRVE